MPGEGLGAPVIANGLMYLSDGIGGLYAFPAAGCGAPTCGALWQNVASFLGAAQPAVVDGHVLVTDFGGAFHSFGLLQALAQAAHPAPQTLRPDLTLRVTG